MSYCKSCGAEIFWVETTKGKKMPLNKKAIPFWENPYSKHSIVTASGKVIKCDLSGNRDEVSGFGYTSHFSTCPEAKKFRRRR